MKTVSFTEFRKHASDLFSDVENGEKILIMRHGKSIAEINPVASELKNPEGEAAGAWACCCSVPNAGTMPLDWAIAGAAMADARARASRRR